MNKVIRSLITLAALGVAATLQAQSAIKLVTVDMAKVYETHYKTEEANAKFNEAAQKAQEQLDELAKQVQGLADQYKDLVEQSKNTVLKPEVRSNAEAEAQKKLETIQRLQNDAQNFRVNTQRSLQQRMKTHHDLVLEEITKVVKDISRARGATLVLDKSGLTASGISAVIYADAGYDITDDVVKEVNKDRPPAPAAATPPAATPPAATAPANNAAPVQFNVPNVTPKKP
ncbi:MAG: OmpH family outer membrane protein [Opitutae bacterium]|nr:OmpH family outer membrane protein [Opitutae bacterium]